MDYSKFEHRKCVKCEKKVQKHKTIIKCCICNNSYHPKCHFLTPVDIDTLINNGFYDSWSCNGCNVEAIPLNYFDDSITNTSQIIKNRTVISAINCHTCSKLGSRMKICDMCDNKSHKRCHSGEMGCKKCLREIYPGYDLENYFTLTHDPNFSNTALFNPYDFEDNANNIGVADSEDPEALAEQETWAPYSKRLISCNYEQPDSIGKTKEGELRTLTLNIRSVIKNISQIRDNMAFYSKFDIICLNEAMCNEDLLPFEGKELMLENFHQPIVQKPARDSSRGGGLVVYLNKNLCNESDFKKMDELCDNNDYTCGEFLFLEIVRTNNKNIIIGNTYRSPSNTANPQNYVDNLEKKLNLLDKHKNKIIVFLGDTNLDLLKYDSDEAVRRYFDLLQEHGFAPLISRPTRITSHSATLIDHIFTNSCTSVTKSGIITTDVTDHLAPYANMIIDRHKQSKRNYNFLSNNQRDFSEENLEKFKLEINEMDWNFIGEIHDANEKYAKFEEKYNEIYINCFPTKSRTNNQRKIEQPWILPWLKCACDRKNNLYWKFVKDPSAENEQIYLKMKVFVAKHIRKAKAKFHADYFKRFSYDGRKQWQMINSLLNRGSKSKRDISKLKEGEKTITDSNEIAKKFNEFFCNIAQNLKDTMHSNVNGDSQSSMKLKLSSRCLINMSNVECTIEDVQKYIKSLKNKATSDLAVGPLKHVYREISPVIHDLLSCSFAQGVFPEPLKCAKVIPLHKNGSKTDATNYRPISLLSVFSKIYERTMHVKLIEHLNSNNVLHVSQYGFRAGHSCEHALFEAQNNLTLALDRKQIALLLLVDFSKAFDMVDHEILLRKLEHCGIRGTNLKWFASYLANRKQYVHVNNQCSEQLPLKYSVPQGSILGPTLFIIYINDLPEIFKQAKFIFFADDANIIVTGDSVDELQSKINILQSSLDNWVRINGLKLNIKKTKFMVFTNKKVDLSSIEVTLDNTKIKKSDEERFLGVIMDSKLNWKAHIKRLASKISRNAGILYKLKGIVPNIVLRMVYNSFIQSHLNYCSCIWGLGSKGSVKSIFIAQKKSVRAIENGFVNYFYNKETGELPSHTKDIFNRNQMLTVHNIIAKNCLIAMHRIYKNSYPKNVMSICQISHESRPRRQEQFFKPSDFRTKKSERTLPYAGAKLYNLTCNSINALAEPDESKLQNKFLNGFKNRITDYLLTVQSTGDEEWNNENFLLYNV